ncbi:MAG TPA: hypothetical protein VF405_00795 [Gammaproteobacteria bacterium]
MKRSAPKVREEDPEGPDAQQARPEPAAPLHAPSLEQELPTHSGAAQQLELDRA